MPQRLIVLVNESSSIQPWQVEIGALAILEGLKRYCDDYQYALPRVGVEGKRGDAPPDAIVCPLVDTVSDPNAIAWHSEDSDGRVFAEMDVQQVLRYGGGILDGGQAASGVFQGVDHEVKEILADAHVNLWADAMDGTEVAFEPADPFQGGLLMQTVTYQGSAYGVLLSDYALPAWFDPQAPSGAQMSATGAGSRPFVHDPSGYRVWRPASGQQSQDNNNHLGLAPQTPAAACGLTKASILGRLPEAILEFGECVPEWQRKKIRRRVAHRLLAKEILPPTPRDLP